MNKIRMIFQILRSLIPSMYFNFHYLPFRQAVKLPVLLYKPHLQKLGGGISYRSRQNINRYDQIGISPVLFLS